MNWQQATIPKSISARPASAAGLRRGVGLYVDRFVMAEVVPQVMLYLLIVGGMFVLFTATEVMNYVTSGVSLWVMAELVLLYLPQYIVIAFPMAMLLGAILGFTKLSADSEAVALLAAGVSFRRMLVPPAIVGAVLMAAGIAINNTLVPYSTNRLAQLKAEVLKQPAFTTKPFWLPPTRKMVGNDAKLQATIWVEGGIDSTNKEMQRVYIDEVDPVTNQPLMVIYARSASCQGGNSWILKDVDVLKAGTITHADYAKTSDIQETPSDLRYLNTDPDSLDFQHLRKKIQTLKARGIADAADLRDAEVNLWNKICLPIACFVFAFVGAALGFRPQRSASRGMAIGIGVLMIFCYYALFKGMEVAATNGMANPFLAASLPIFFACILGGVLVARTPS